MAPPTPTLGEVFLLELQQLHRGLFPGRKSRSASSKNSEEACRQRRGERGS